MAIPPEPNTPQMRERTLRLVASVRADYPTEAAAMAAVAGFLGISAETVSDWQQAASTNDSKPTKTPKHRLLRMRSVIAGVIVVVLGGLGLAYAESWLGSIGNLLTLRWTRSVFHQAISE